MSQQKDPTSLYQALDRLSDALQTNIPKELIKQLLSSHITKTGDWHFETVNVTGRGQTGGLKSFAMPNAQLYMMVPNPQSVAEAQAKIRANSQ